MSSSVRSWSWIAQLVVALLLSGAVGLALLLYVSECDRRAANEREAQILAFERAAAPAIAFLKTEYVRTGRFPIRIPDGLQTELNEKEPRWSYGVSTNGLFCSLGYGDYLKDGYRCFWSSDEDAWIVDD